MIAAVASEAARAAGADDLPATLCCRNITSTAQETLHTPPQPAGGLPAPAAEPVAAHQRCEAAGAQVRRTLSLAVVVTDGARASVPGFWLVPDDDIRRFDPPRLVEVARDGRRPGTQSAWAPVRRCVNRVGGVRHHRRTDVRAEHQSGPRPPSFHAALSPVVDVTAGDSVVASWSRTARNRASPGRRRQHLSRL